MADQELHVVTGAFGYSGRCIAERLLEAGHRVRTLTNSPHRANPFGGRVEARSFHFDDPARLVESLRGARVLYNTYWVRFNTREFTFAQAVRHSRTLFAAAEEAGVGRIVHVSITNPSEDSPLEYFRGKAQVERALVQSGLPHTILRPAVLFGREDILVNNIAWALRRMPVFTVFGDGLYRLQPIHVDDLAALAVQEGRADGSRTIDAIGPETFTYRGLVETVSRAIGKVRPILSVAPTVGRLGAWLVGKVMDDVMLTRDEVRGLMAGLLATDSLRASPTGPASTPIRWACATPANSRAGATARMRTSSCDVSVTNYSVDCGSTSTASCVPGGAARPARTPSQRCRRAFALRAFRRMW